MPTIAEIRKQYPQYHDMTDQQLGDSLYKKFYSDMPRAEFDQKVGLSTGLKSGILGDVIKAGAAGLARGVGDVVGLPGTLSDLFNNGMSYVTGLPKLPQSPLSSGSINTAMGRATGGATDYQGETVPGQFSGTVGEFLPGAAASGGMGVGNLLRFGALPGVASEAGGQLTKGTAAEPYARVAGALVGPAGPALAKRVVTPFEISPARQKMIDVLTKEGVPLTAGQKTGSKMLRYMESELGGGAAQDMMDTQGGAFTKAAMSRVGSTADSATPEAMDQALKSVGDKFDTLSARNSITPDPQLVTGMRDILKEYTDLGGTAPLIKNSISDIVSGAQKGAVSGDLFKTVTSRLARAARGTSDPELKIAALNLRRTLDDAMERSIATNNPSDLGAWKEARQQYKNFITLEKASTGAGENAALGHISPSALRNATVTKGGRRAYATGKGDFADLSRAGEAIMKPLPQSGTAPRTAARNLGTGLSSILGAGAGASAGGAPGAVIGTVAGTVVPHLAGRAMLSAPGRAYLANQLISPMKITDPRYRALVDALLARDGSSGQ